MSKQEAVATAQDHQYDRTKVVQIVHSVIAKMEGVSGATQEAVIKELHALLDVIETVRRDIAGTRVQDVSKKHVPTATDELDAVVDATRSATDNIMSACEAMEKMASGKSDPMSSAVLENVTKIYEACSFQDITGQRIKKVVTVLREIEGKVSHLLSIMGEHPEGHKTPAPQDNRSDDQKLMNGPQLPANAISQEEIDKLLASFD